MNNKQLAAILILIISLALFYVSWKKYNEKNEINAEYTSANERISNAEQDKNKAIRARTTLKAKSKLSLKFYDDWMPHFKKITNQKNGENLIDEIVNSSKIFNTERKIKSRRSTITSFKKVVEAVLVFDDSYVNSLNSFSKIESQFPTIRVMSCSISPSNKLGNILMKIIIEVPINNY